MAKRRVGSNQYRTRNGGDIVQPSGQDLMKLAAGTSLNPYDTRRRCGEVWETGCRAWVQPPLFSHGSHGFGADSVKRWTDDTGNPRLNEALRRVNCPTATLEWASYDQHSQYRRLAAEHFRCPPQVLQRLAQDPDEGVRRMVANNMFCPPEILDQMAHQPDIIAAEVARNINTSSRTLGWMPINNAGVAINVARNPNTPSERLRQLVLDPSFDYSDLALENSNCPSDLVVQMLGSDESLMRAAALRSRALPEEYRQLRSIT